MTTPTTPSGVPRPTTAPSSTPAPPDGDSAAGSRAPEKAAPAAKPVSQAELHELVSGSHANPHSVLGAHVYDGAVTVRSLRPLAETVEVVVSGEPELRVPLTHEALGVWVGVLPLPEVPDYRLDVTYGGFTSRVDDPYRFLPTLGPLDLHLVGEGRHERLWEILGAHTRTYDTPSGVVRGTSFAVWAPNARGVRVVGDFNHWDGTTAPMRSLGSSGVWELFIPDVGDGTRYKYAVLGRDGVWRQQADPLAQRTEVPPATASIVYTSGHTWSDAAWMSRRASAAPHREPMSIYEVHLGSWRAGRSYTQLADELVDYVSTMGFTHVQFLPIAEHPFGGSWGYQVTSYYAPTARFGEPDDFRYLVDKLHQAGIGVLVDWVPAHFPKDAWALARFDGTPLYEHADPRRGEQPDWGTLVFDFGRAEVRNFLVANALYWLKEFHIDGLRVDAVASMLYLDYSRKEGEWTPNVYGGRENLDAVSFLQEMNATVYRDVPGVVTIAEESTAWPGVTRPTHLGGLGFGMKWNMGWMHDSLEYVSHDPVHRVYHHHQMTFAMVYAFSENYVLPLSHDEVVHGKGSLLRKMPGDRWQQLANLRALLSYMWAHPGKQLLFMGGEIGQEAEWSESRELDWWLLDHPEHRGLQQLVRDMNKAYRDNPALWSQDIDPAGFAWIDANDAAGNVFSFLRHGTDGSTVAIAVNFSGGPHENYRLGLPYAGTWTEVVNTDAEAYGGSGVGNLGAVEATEVSYHGLPASAVVRVPPLGSIWLRYSGDGSARAGGSSEKSSATPGDESSATPGGDSAATPGERSSP
jgi:1,4-alpha-glucan branching enzyme